MTDKDINIIKYSGKKVKFSVNKLYNSLKKTGAEDVVVNQIIEKVKDELYEGISTKEIYDRAFSLLKKRKIV